MKRHLSASSALLPFAMIACSGGVAGSGSVVREARYVEPFAELTIAGHTRIELTLGGEVTASVETDRELLRRVALEVEDGRLEVIETEEIDPTLLVVHLTTPFLKQVDAAGESSADLRGLRADRFVVHSAGLADVELEGSARELVIASSGSANTHAGALTAERVNLVASGDVHLAVYARRELDAELNGSSSLDYYGNPREVDVDTRGASSAEAK